VIEALVADRAGDGLVRLPFGQLTRRDAVEQLLDGAAQGER